MKQDNDPNQDIGEGVYEGTSEDTGESILSSNIEEDDLDHQQEVLLLRQARQDK